MAISIHAPTLASETIAHIGAFELRNTMVMAWLAMALLIGLGLLLRRTKYREVPGRVQAFFEMLIEGLFDFFDSIVQDPKATRRFFPLVATILIFITIANWMGILPGVNSITIEGMHDGHLIDIPIFRSMNADVNMTLAIAIISVVATQAFGIPALGMMPYVAPLPFLGLEIFVGFIQGLVFSLLTLVFLKMAITVHGGHDHEDHAVGHSAHAT